MSKRSGQNGLQNRTVDFALIGRLPAAGDNVAIASGKLSPGTRFRLGNKTHTIVNTLLEGQRFAIAPIAKGEALLSWGLPFGHALRAIEPGEYVCNAGILEALGLRRLEFDLPEQANFEDYRQVFQLEEDSFKPGRQVERYEKKGRFEGFLRAGGRGIGTRNCILILATSSLTAGFARMLESRLKSEADSYPNIDRIVAVCHTEGGTTQPNNGDLVLRTLAGFMVHPNAGAVLAVDYGTESVNNLKLERYLKERNYPIDHVIHRFHTLEADFNSELDQCEAQVREWLEPVAAFSRSSQPLSGLKIALQCGGSDAFSGVSGNPLAGWVAKEAIRHGGSAALAETDELIGAEPYILGNTRDLDTARQFLQKIATFRQRVAWHGHSAEGNPTGGNKFRGLYNITLKSIGAARKKDPEVCLDHVIDYGQPMKEPGFYFMDSPGNDLESIAGQVAAGCNLIFFITGNGSITNFPFVPTIKFVTTTGRWKLLEKDMDINAGRYQDGMPMDELGYESFGYTVQVASGKQSVGERAGHSQVSIWRDWRQTDDSQLQLINIRRRPNGKPIPVQARKPPGINVLAFPSENGWSAEQLGLILPTSLCSGQIAQQIARRMNAGLLPSSGGVSRFVALPHTEGCGASSGENEDHFTRTLLGHLLNPMVRKALLLEHGCEHTHNDLMRHEMGRMGVDPARFGYASIQLDGGIEAVTSVVEKWFEQALLNQPASKRQSVSLEALPLGLMTVGNLPPAVATALAEIARALASNEGTVVIPSTASLLQSEPFLQSMGWSESPVPSLNYGQFALQAGLHIMDTPTEHTAETLTGLGGTGVQLILAHVADRPVQGHPMIPLLQVTSRGSAAERFAPDLDAVLQTDEARAPSDRDDEQKSRQIVEALLELLSRTGSAAYEPRSRALANSGFQLTRGLTGVSL